MANRRTAQADCCNIGFTFWFIVNLLGMGYVMNYSRCFRIAALLGAALSAAAQPKPLSSFDAQVKPLLARMTLAEKIGQMTQPDQEYIKDPALGYGLSYRGLI
jgi:hypothetical protein